MIKVAFCDARVIKIIVLDDFHTLCYHRFNFLKLIFLFSIEPTVAQFLENESLKNKICCNLDDSHGRNWENLLDLLN